MNERTLGQIIDGLGLSLDLEPSQEITDVLVIGKVIDMEDGELTLITRWSTSLSWIERRGMLRVAETEEGRTTQNAEEDL